MQSVSTQLVPAYAGRGRKQANGMDALRAATLNGMIPFLWLHVPVAWELAAISGKSSLAAAGVAGAAALFATLARLSGQGVFARVAVGTALMVIVSAMLFATPSTYMIDTHMYYFAALGFLALFVCPLTIIAAAGVVAVHHLGLNFLMPLAVFPAGADIVRVVIHAAILVIEAVALILVSARMSAAMQEAGAAKHVAEKAQEAAEQLARERQSQAEMQAALAAEQERRRIETERFARDFVSRMSSVIEGLAGTSGTLRSASGNLVDVAETASRQSSQVSDRSSQTAQAVSAVAAAATEMDATISEVSSRASASTRSMEGVRSQVEGAQRSIDELSGAAEKVSSVLELISAIAAQTNLLALNATIEAARAGENGRGFAVVASEVKQLAAQSEKAVSEIGGYIGTMRGAMTDTGATVRQFSEAMGSILEASSSIAAAVEQQHSAVRQIGMHLEDVTHNTAELDGSARQLNTSAMDTDSRARDILRASTTVSENAEVIRKALSDFERMFSKAA